MARDWQPNFEQLVDEHQSMVFSLALSADPNHLNEEIGHYEHRHGSEKDGNESD